MHQAGIEVILDVVYNHTAEGNHLGPTLSMKGIDNPAYYRLVEDDLRYYMDYTGTGNSLNVRHPHSLQLIMDSLRYWVTEMHVDGFRFDLASTLAREFYDVDRLATFFELVQQDPVVSQVKLIAEPWDIGPGGYQVGGFPPQWTEWNGAYRDTVRDFWRGEPSLGEFASRVAGSSDLYEHSGRRPVASINFVTAHDGFTLRDLVSYNEKHNEANGEDNNDGESHNRSWNHGVEGPTDDPEILALPVARAAQPPGHAAAQPGRADAPARRRARPDPAGQQQHLRPGQRAELGALGRGRPAARRVHRRASSSCAAAPDVPPQALLHRQHRPHRAGRGQERLNDIVWLHLDGRPMEDDRLGGRRPGPRHVPQRPRHRRRGRPRRAPSSTTTSCSTSTPTVTVDGDAAARGVRRGVGRRDRHRRLRRRGRRCSRPAATMSIREHRSLLVLREHSAPEVEPDLSVAASVAASVAGHRRTWLTGYRLARDRSPPEHLPAPDHAGVRPVRGGEACCPTCTTSASTGSTSRRCWRRSPAATHGYDVVAHDRVDPARGGSDGLAVLASAARRRWAWACSSTSCPTTSASPRPRPATWWWDVLEHGPASAYASYFDIDWDAGGGRLLVPVVGDDDEDAIEVDADAREVRYHELRLPMAPSTTTLDEQHYELASWRRGDAELNYRRFFTVDHARRDPGRGARGLRRVARRDPAAGSTRASSTGCASTTPTGCATPVATSTTWPR